MTDRTPADPHPAPPPASAHAHDDAATTGHGAAHDAHAGGHEDHGHAAEPLGPIDLPAWGAGLVGLLVAAITLVAFALATGALAQA